MTVEDVTPCSRGTKCPGDASSLSLEIKEGAGNAGCQVAPAALRANGKSTQASHYRYAETIRHSLRDGLRAYTCSPRCTGLVSHRCSQIITCKARHQRRGARTTRFR